MLHKLMLAATGLAVVGGTILLAATEAGAMYWK